MSSAPPNAPSTTPGTDDVIRTVGLSKTYPGGTIAVDALDLSVRPGEIFGLLGPNGAGKTTTVSMLTTRVVPTGGRALVAGVDVMSDPAGAKRFIGVVPQVNTLDRSLNVWENLYFHCRYFGMRAKEARAAADEVLEKLRLAGRRKADVETLSGGMARRLMVGRAIVHRPAVLFLDEPTAGLDPQSRLALWDIVAQLHDEGQTIFLTTHYMEEADRFCDRVAIMDHGRILALDAPSGLKQSFGAGAAVTMKVEGDLDGLARRLMTIPGAMDVKAVDTSVRVLFESADGALPNVISLVEQEGFRISDVAVSEDSLETVFINLTGRDLRE